jgi:uncharacterized membrane protein
MGLASMRLMTNPPNVVLFLGRLHPLLVHLPIGFLTLLAVIEVARRLKWFKASAHARAIMLAATVASVIVTIVCGLMLSTEGGYDPALLAWHKWMGISLGIFVIATACAFYAKRPRVYAGMLIATFALLGPASHFGGSITHGKNYLFAYAPMWMRPTSDQPVIAVATAQKLADVKQTDVYTDLVQPVLKENCLACHCDDKVSGQLKVDTYSNLMHGGKSGPAIIAKDSANSPLIQRILLAHADAHHMSPDGKPQPSEDQIAVLQWWIDSGAAEHKKVGDTDPNVDQIALASRLMKLPMPGEAPTIAPIPLVDLQAPMATAASKTGVVISLTSADQPWLIINAAINRKFGDAELAQLTSLAANIVDLDLAGTKVTDPGLAPVATMQNLHRLRLDRTSITDAGLRQLRGLRKLEYLNLYSTSITDAGLKTLAALPNLRHIYVWKTRVDPAAAELFVAAKSNKTRIAQIQKQIEKLQAELSSQHVEVVDGLRAPASQPTTRP